MQQCCDNKNNVLYVFGRLYSFVFLLLCLIAGVFFMCGCCYCCNGCCCCCYYYCYGYIHTSSIMADVRSNVRLSRICTHSAQRHATLFAWMDDDQQRNDFIQISDTDIEQCCLRRSNSSTTMVRSLSLELKHNAIASIYPYAHKHIKRTHTSSVFTFLTFICLFLLCFLCFRMVLYVHNERAHTMQLLVNLYFVCMYACSTGLVHVQTRVYVYMWRRECGTICLCF